MTKPTPGPWHVIGPDDDRALIESDDGGVVCDLMEREMRGEATANAHLVSAAPDLLAALEAMMAHDSAAGPCDVPGLKCDCYANARAALKKARGQ